MKRITIIITLVSCFLSNCFSQDDFYWKEFDKPYFVFIHDDANSYLTTFAELFMENEVPISFAVIPSRLDDKKIDYLKKAVEKGGEILAHYSASPTDAHSDALWLSCTRDVKIALEELGFEINGLIRANSTQRKSNKGEMFCRLYFKYANEGMGQSLQYDLPRKLMLSYKTFDDFFKAIKSNCRKNGIHAYGFHGDRADEEWVTTENLQKIIDYIKSTNCEFTTYKRLYDDFGVLATTTSVQDVQEQNKRKKIIVNSQLRIVCNESMYSIQGQKL